MKMKKKQAHHHDKGHSRLAKDNELFRTTMIYLAISLIVGFLHSQHLYHLFENDRFFSALSPLERDLSFRTEMGLYYSYYKTIVKSPSFTEGVSKLVYDNVTEYPDTINTLKRFNLYPEVVLGGSFRFIYRLLKALNVKSDCYGITRGQGQPPITTCKGIREPHYFYVYSVFGLNSLLPVALFLLSCYLSDSILGGVISVLMFFYNHGEATRVMWSPPLRECFAMPFFFLQLLSLTFILKSSSRMHWMHYLSYGLSSLLFLIPWQFAQFTLLTQVLCLFTLYGLRVLQVKKFFGILITLSFMLCVNVVLQFGNVLLLTSYLAMTVPSCLIIISLRKVFNVLKWPPLILIVELFLCVSCSLFLKRFVTNTFGVTDDAHIGDILLSKFTSFSNFHTQLYTCAAEFDFISITYFGKLSLTLLLPVVCVVVLNILWQVVSLYVFGRKHNIVESETVKVAANKKQVKSKGTNSSEQISKSDQQQPNDGIEVSFLYHCLQCLAFAIMAILIMRLKLFLTPAMAVIAGLITSKKIFPGVSAQYRISLTYCVIVASSISGLWNLSDQMKILGEYNNPELEQLVHWINTSTPQDGVFAGSMPIMATVKLATLRPIVNHPHYEDTNIRTRTKLIYTVYSKRDVKVINDNLRSLQVQYLVMEDIWCNKQYREGCTFHDIFLVEFPEDVDNPLFCLQVQNEKAIPGSMFKQVYKNKMYQVLQLV